ncbi:MAG: peptidase T [Oscillospiraceae bacterium]|jgi:tripeptide aminopeptidase|nr:peptidase T [Oscillospiraceae bacterium]
MTASERLLNYVRFDTTSDPKSPTCPSSDKQRLLGQALVEEMQGMGISDAYMDKDGYVYGTVPGADSAPVIGLIAHMDTSPDCAGSDIQAWIVKYTGGDIVLHEEKGIVLRVTDFPRLANSAGKHLIVTDGTTLLGADDKAGIAAILTAAEELMASNEHHATIRIAFTPDEEIGRGTDRFNLKDFGAQYAYTIDGGTLGELEYENFNAASATVVVHGRNVHPGYAKNSMINAQNVAMEFHAMLPVHDRPECTEGYEGFFHLSEFSGSEEESTLFYIIRDHDREKFEARKALFLSIASLLNARYGGGCVEVVLADSYYNMREKIEPHMEIVDAMVQAMRDAGVTPKIVPVRGGTDGARLSYEGLPCPNLFTGAENYHGRFEYIPVEDLDACVRCIKHMLKNTVK